MDVDIAFAYDQALELLAADIAATRTEVGALSDVPRPVTVLLFGAEHSAAMGFGGAAANRLNTARGIISGRITVASDATAAADAQRFNEQFSVGDVVHSTPDAENAKVDSVARIEAETNRVFVRLRFRTGYATRYITDLTEVR